MQHTVAQILAEAATIEEATPRILRAMGECLGWDVGALWRVDREAEALRCVELWHKASIEIPEFERADWQFTFNPGVGLPGRVWSSLKPAYIPDVVLDKNLPRGPIAEREGLHAAVGFPILLGSEVLGVIEFFSREIRPPGVNSGCRCVVQGWEYSAPAAGRLHDGPNLRGFFMRKVMSAELRFFALGLGRLRDRGRFEGGG